MNPPSVANRLLGSLPVFTVVVALAAIMTTNWWRHPDTESGWIPIIALVASGVVWNARKQLNSYKSWKHSWDAMEGRPVPSPYHGLKALLLLPLAVLLSYATFSQLTKDPPQADELLIGLTFLVVSGFLYQWGRWNLTKAPKVRKPRQVKAKAEYVATVSLPVPKPGRLPTLSDLPAYCQELLRRR